MKISYNWFKGFSLRVGLLMGCLSISLQAQEQRPQTISSVPREVMLEVNVDGDKKLGLNGKAIFTPTEGNSDDTLTGVLVYEISDDSRRLLAKQSNKLLTEILNNVTVKEVIAQFERHAKCPELRFEFSEVTIAVAGSAGRAKRFKLIFPETEQELSKLLCQWARRVESGRGTRGMASRFNRLVKGDKDGQ